jgi:hypothetical protein
VALCTGDRRSAAAAAAAAADRRVKAPNIMPNETIRTSHRSKSHINFFNNQSALVLLMLQVLRV